MNKIIREQLSKCINADLSHYDSDKHEYFIPRKTELKLEVNSQYLIHTLPLAKDPNSVVNINWNKGQAPKDDYYKIDIEKMMAKMIYVNGLVYDKENDVDLNTFWSGWLNKESIEVIEKL